MHLRNIHRYGYDFQKLIVTHPELENHLVESPTGTATIDFSDAASILEFNTALLKHHYKIKYWKLPEGSLYPPIPGRADYIHHLADLVGKGSKNGLDIGCGASAIYPILGNSIYDWKMVGCDVDDESVAFAKKNTSKIDAIEIRQQIDKGNIFKGVILEGESYDFTICNPPFYGSEEEAVKANMSKQRKLGTYEERRNFAGHAHELWCNGGEALFIKRMIKESVAYKGQVEWFTCLLSRKQNLKKPLKQLEKLQAEVKVIEMATGNKESRFVAWRFKS
ncbi:23S rRNA (adenine(1618)-N(6))-methyltransferase RlmF [Nonlabens sp. Ci31]|jgi:23S rRNA (adenine1618-N6)-methyltransferase|uniref:23S rRNA (adenine(1618)-N(6))-methyltransferase RlmF n=1 Tax=Nonlabens sp. Ci31 TaxID=2608253 RepID=UPI001462F299|nr:23S rRNA (adenine(1618)-N(6))-methyltransferase RlmF [Nonlabens sp. Ci31]QJP34519.1 23S rRNA (adenine(1618)-N(6))-methyltransferase RlmF [Nonlabens sp. Ci31]